MTTQNDAFDNVREFERILSEQEPGTMEARAWYAGLIAAKYFDHSIYSSKPSELVIEEGIIALRTRAENGDYLMRLASAHRDELDAEITALSAEVVALRNALRGQVVAQYTLGHTNEHCCDECASCWKVGGPEHHREGCLAEKKS